MAEFFEMPQASPTMETGTLLAWRKPEGAELAPQDVIAEVETDKAAMEIEVFDKCFMLKHLAEEGEDIPAGQPIAIIGKSADEDIAALVAQFEEMMASGGAAAPAADAPAQAAPQAASPEPVAAPAPAAPLKAGFSPYQWEGQALNSSIMENGGSFFVDAEGVVRASPLARKIAADKGVDLSSVSGSGPHGRVLKADVEAAASRPTSTGGGVTRGEDVEVRNSRMRRVIAQRLKESYLDAPVFFLTANFNCDRLVSFRKELNAQLLEAKGVKVSYNDLTVAAVAKALAEVPEANATWGDKAITRFGSVDVGVAVALEDGLITPIVRNADQKSLSALSVEVADLVSRARDRKLDESEYTGAGFSVSNLGMMGIEQFTAIINPPASAILAVGALQQEPVVVDGALSVGWRMRVTMTCDHRVIDGALGARYLQALRRYIENPLLMVV